MLKNSACQDVAGGPDCGAVEIWNSFQNNFSKIFSWLIHEHATNTASQPFLNLITSMAAWSDYTSNHSEHYFHLTYVDNLFINLLGIIPIHSKYDLSYHPTGAISQWNIRDTMAPSCPSYGMLMV